MANGMLGGFDSQEIQQMMAQFGATEKERQDANKQALFALGFGLLGGRKGNELQTIGRAGLGAMDYRNRTLADIPQQKAQQFNAATQMLSLQDQLRKRQEEAQLRQAVAGYKPPTPQSAAMAGMPSLAPTPQNAATFEARIAQQPQQQGVYERQLALADYLEGKGFIQQAETTRANAEKFAPKYKGMETVMGPGGQPTLLQTYENRAPVPVAGGYQPKPDLQILSLGNRQEAIDKLRVQPGQTWTPGMSPSDVAVDARARAQLAQSAQHHRENLGKPTMYEGQFMYPPSAGAPTGRAVTPAGFVPKPTEARRKELDSIDAELNIIGGAKKGVKEQPDAFGLKRGAATLAGPVAESVAGRFDTSEQRNVRSYVFNVVSKSINERAGAAQSTQELARLRSFLPGELDNDEQIIDKLEAYEKYLGDRRKAYAGGETRTSGGATGGWTVTEVK